MLAQIVELSWLFNIVLCHILAYCIPSIMFANTCTSRQQSQDHEALRISYTKKGLLATPLTFGPVLISYLLPTCMLIGLVIQSILTKLVTIFIWIQIWLWWCKQPQSQDPALGSNIRPVILLANLVLHAACFARNLVLHPGTMHSEVD